jgi:hypothetical protein
MYALPPSRESPNFFSWLEGRVLAAKPFLFAAPDTLTGLCCAQANFDEKYWRAAYPSMIGTIAAASAWSFVRLALGSYGNRKGWVEYRVCCSTIYEFYEGVEAQQLSAILYEAIFSGFWLVMLLGFRIDYNLLAFLLRTVVPLSVRVRFSGNGKVFHLWHSDGALNVGAFGNFLGWCTAIGVAPIAVSPWLFWADDNALVRGSGDQLSWLIVVIVIALRLRVTQAAALIVPSIVSTWVGIFVFEAREGGESLYFSESESSRLSIPPSPPRPLAPSLPPSLAPSLAPSLPRSPPPSHCVAAGKCSVWVWMPG